MVSTVLIALVASATLNSDPGITFKELAGGCFETHTPEGFPDTHCFTVSPGGKLVMDVHKLRINDDKIAYEGVTVYSPGVDGNVIYNYSNSYGQVMPGLVTREGDELDFTITVGAGKNRLKWILTNDGYDVVSGQVKIHYRKIGPSGDVGL